MRRTTRCLSFMFFLVMPMSASAGEPPVDLGKVTEKHEMVPMRDGKKLSVYLYFPEGKGPWPAIFQQRYLNVRSAATRKDYARLAAHGYAVAVENFRGTHLSEGTWVGYRSLGWGELKDGYDTVEWLAKQPWCTGKIGTMGGSQSGYAQNFLAVTRPPHLVCQYMIDTGLSLYHEGYRFGGTIRLGRLQSMEKMCRDPEENRRLVREWFDHPTYDSYWADEDCTRHFAKMNVPCFTVGGYFDVMSVGSIESYMGRQHRGDANSRGKQQLILGPWPHGRAKEINKVGEMVFPENARFAIDAHIVRWFDHYLKGIDNGIERDPVVRYYVMGATDRKDAPGNEWRTASDWPVPAKLSPYYLRSEGRLSTQAPGQAEGFTSFQADPQHPNKLNGPVAGDGRAFEKQADVRTFTSDVLTEPVEWTGKVQAKLQVSSTAKDTDFIVRISDVYPDGRSFLLTYFVRRARYREGFEKEVLMEPGKVYKVAFDVGWISQVFDRGHRIRVAITSSGGQYFEPNPNTGERLTYITPQRMEVATNSVHHDRQNSSCILAPVR